MHRPVIRRSGREQAASVLSLSQAWPGVLVCVVAAGLALALAGVVTVMSPLLTAILLGVTVTAIRPLPSRLAPGLAFSGRTLLRAGIVLLGLQLSLREIAALGPGAVLLVISVVAGGIAGTMWLGKLLGLTWTQRLLIACGFSICGAAAVAAVDGSVEADDSEVATAIGLVVVFGTAMIGLVPLASGLVGLDAYSAGMWAGASIHEVAQVVAAGGMLDSGAIAVAVVVKLARVLMLAPVLAWVSWRRRRQAAHSPAGTLPPIVPGFVAGFVALVVVNTWLPLSDQLLTLGAIAAKALLCAAMFALGCAVPIRSLHRGASRPMLLAAAATAWVAVIGLAGTLLLAL